MKWAFPAGQTPLDPQELVGLKLKNLKLQSELNLAEAKNIAEAEFWLFTQSPEIESLEFLQALHKNMFGKVWSWAGVFRTTERNIGIHPWEIRQVLTQVLENLKLRTSLGESRVDLAVEFHHQLLFIHPFPNGNGRWARRVTELHCEYLSIQPPRWIELTQSNAAAYRDHYLAALKAADRGDPNPLKELMF